MTRLTDYMPVFFIACVALLLGVCIAPFLPALLDAASPVIDAAKAHDWDFIAGMVIGSITTAYSAAFHYKGKR